jgi:hypothetical protein
MATKKSRPAYNAAAVAAARAKAQEQEKAVEERAKAFADKAAAPVVGSTVSPAAVVPASPEGELPSNPSYPPLETLLVKETPKAKNALPNTKRARITTDRGPFWRGKPMQKNQLVELPNELFDTLKKRGWAAEA